MNSSGGYFLVGLILLILAAAALEYVRSRQRGGQQYDLHEAALIFVQAAEQMFPGQSGGDKLNWVMAQLGNLGFTHLDPTFLRVAIESAVYALRNGNGKASG